MHDAPAPTPKDWARFRPGALAGVTQMNAHFTEHSFERHSHETYSIGVTASGVSAGASRAVWVWRPGRGCGR